MDNIKDKKLVFVNSIPSTLSKETDVITIFSEVLDDSYEKEN
ncbi:MAG TPA: hypothetical protein P5509_05585 [Bacteroidales bacterium]|nr:hypothetical protein [Bacteroidales bacterium]